MFSRAASVGAKALRSPLPSVTATRTSVRAFSASLDASKLQVQRTTEPKTKLPKEQLVFGKTFTDHWLRCPWTETEGWKTPQVLPYGPMVIDPASAVFHYAIECFEGMKAYRGSKGEIRLFRPMMNMQRMNNSVARLFLPTFDGEEMLKAIVELIKVDKDWVPEGDGYSLYIRPTGISTEATLGVGPSRSAEIFTIMSPVGPYYPEGFKPVSLYATSKYQRAWPGGTGNTKIGGNYSPTIMPQAEATRKGFTQVLWLFGDEQEVTEVGTMNFFVLWINEDGEKELVTAPLDGTVLPGVTRDSTLALAREWGEFKVTERKYYFHELAKAADEGRLLEAFGTGTAAVVSPVRHVNNDGKGYDIPLDPSDPSAGAGPVTKRVWSELLDIQYGRKEHPWSVVIA